MPPPRKLSDEQIRDIYRSAWAEIEPRKDLAARHGIACCTISDIKHGRLYAKVTGHEPVAQWFEDLHGGPVQVGTAMPRYPVTYRPTDGTG